MLEVAASVVVLGGLGGAVSSAAPVDQPDVAHTNTTLDGWQMTLALTGLRINAVPNMAATPFTKEGFVSAKATVAIDGDGSMPVNAGSIVMGVQLGCQVSLNEGLDLGFDHDFNLDDEPDAGISPDIGIDLRPGSIKTLGLGAKPLKGRIGAISVQDAHIAIDGCGGPVAARVFAWAQMTTDTSDDSVSTYGELSNL